MDVKEVMYILTLVVDLASWWDTYLMEELSGDILKFEDSDWENIFSVRTEK